MCFCPQRPFWERVREVRQARQQQSTQSSLLGREERRECPSPLTETVHIMESLSLSLLRAHQARVDRLKHGLVFPPSLFSSQCPCLWPLVAHQAWMKRSSPQLSSQTAMIVLQGRQKIASAFWSEVL